MCRQATGHGCLSFVDETCGRATSWHSVGDVSLNCTSFFQSQVRRPAPYATSVIPDEDAMSDWFAVREHKPSHQVMGIIS